jgi:2-(1,2-epoxy-1,2-dihydrophenyl)acetyl-CoA isomerase
MADNNSAVGTAGEFTSAGSYEFIILEKNPQGVARVTLNRPDSLNSLSGPLTKELTDAFNKLAKDETVRAIILTGAGRGFSAGADLKGGPTEGDPADWIREYYNPLIMKLNRLEKPVIGSVNGVAAGAGFSLALACDFRIISEKARFISAFIRIGLVPDSGLGYFLPRLVGVGRALEITATGDEVSAAKALEYGMVNRVVAPEQLEAETLAFATKLAQGPTYAIGLTKKLLNEGHERTLSEVLEMEADAQHLAGKSRDFREGVTSFIEKRPAQFQGR